MRRISEVKAMEGYRIGLTFSDGAQGVVSLAELVGKGVFSVWEDPQEFAKVFVDQATGTVAWPGGIDLDADQLYHDITGTPLPGQQAAAAR